MAKSDAWVERQHRRWCNHWEVAKAISGLPTLLASKMQNREYKNREYKNREYKREEITN